MDKIFSAQKLTVVFQGDSQLWGQGSRGWKEAMPDFKTGELRRLPKSVPSCVNMFEKVIKDIRGNKETAVINAAVGNTPTDIYLKNYFKDMVLNQKPDIVIMMHAINDWICDRNVSARDFKNNLKIMTDEIFETGSDIVMMTQAPVLESDYSGDHFYDDYIEVFRHVANGDNRIILADANIKFKKLDSQYFYEDKWHVNQAGQFVYLKAITDSLGI